MNKYLLILLLIGGWWILCYLFEDYTIPIISVPIFGTVLGIKPFQLLSPLSLMIGALIAIVIMRIKKAKKHD